MSARIQALTHEVIQSARRLTLADLLVTAVALNAASEAEEAAAHKQRNTRVVELLNAARELAIEIAQEGTQTRETRAIVS